MKKKLYKLYQWSNSWTGTIVIVLFVIFFIAQAFRIPSGSMKDTLLIGDHLFAKKFAYGIPMPYIPFLEIPLVPWSDKLKIIDGDKPKRGDIIIFRPPMNVKTHFVKRCVGVPGDEIIVSNKQLYIHFNEGDEWINEHYGKKGYEVIEFAHRLWVKNPYMQEHPGIHHDPKIVNDGRHPLPIFEFGPVKVPQGSYFMMGDNRDHSNDSRFWGPVPYANIEGTPWFIYFSIDKNYEIRWERMFKTPTDLEDPSILKKAIEEREREDKNDHGIY